MGLVAPSDYSTAFACEDSFLFVSFLYISKGFIFKLTIPPFCDILGMQYSTDGEKGEVMKKLGCLVLIIVPWNYPVQRVFSPLIAAVAAGNCVAIKPSDLAPKTQKIVETIIKETFEKD